MVTDPYNDPVIPIVRRTIAARHVVAAVGLAALVAASANAQTASRQAPQSIASWRSAGPELSQVNSLSPDPGDDAAVYAVGSLFAASQSALYGSEDSAGSWTALDEAPRGEFFAEVYADPRGGGRIFAG